MLTSAVEVTFLFVTEAGWKPSLSRFKRLTSDPPGSLHTPLLCTSSVLADDRLPTAQEVTVLSVCP